MNLRLLRISFVLIGGLLSAQFGADYSVLPVWGWFVIGLAFGGCLIGVEILLHRLSGVSIRGSSAAVFGLIFGLIMAKLLSDAIGSAGLEPRAMNVIRLIMTWVLVYMGMVIAMRGQNEFNLVIPYVSFTRQNRLDDRFVIDTSAIIDGRIADLCKTRFLEGRLVIPRFVLRELQTIADSSDAIKRNRGRRGLDVLRELQRQTAIEVRIHEDDASLTGEVDEKLVKLAQLIDAKLVTTDYNLNKVAELQGVVALNVNELAQVLRSVVLPGEPLEVKPIKEGKEPNQSVAYLDDGTMVVVENGRHLIGQTIRAMVISVLQTAAGRMVFVRQELPRAGGHTERMASRQSQSGSETGGPAGQTP